MTATPMTRTLALFSCAVLAGCVKIDNHGVTVPIPSAPPSASQMFKDGLVAAKVRAAVVSVDLDAAARLGVGVKDGTVTLAGTVKTAQERREIEAAVRKVAGVKEIDDLILVNAHAATFSGGDFALAARVTTALAAQTGVNAASLRASAQDGVVTLSGRVPSESIKQTALETVRKTSGVKRVVDRIRVGQ